MDKDATASSDLWALGCIIYQLFAGKPPFRSQTEYLTFDLILKGSVSYPKVFFQLIFEKGFPCSAKKLCEKLLVLDPAKRLGSGPPDSPLGFPALKKHEFFDGIDFANLSKTKPPLDPTQLLTLQKSGQCTAGSSASIGENENTVKSDSLCESPIDPIAELKTKGMLGKLSALDTETVIKEGIVKKKGGWIFYNRRKLLLTSRPRLSYYDSNSGEYKGDIMMTKQVKAEALDSIKFIVKTPFRTYYFKAIEEGTSYDWANAINCTITTYCTEIKHS